VDGLGLLFSLAFFVYFPIAGISSILLARRINDFGHQGVNPLIKSCWIFFTILMIVASGIILAGTILLAINSQDPIIGSLFLITPILVFLSLTIILEIYSYQAVSVLNEGDQFDLPESLRNLTQKVSVLGWILLGVPLLLFSPLLLLFVFIGSLLNILSVHKRANESELLWLLAICVEKKIPIATELDTYSNTLSRSYRDKIQQLSSLLHSGTSLSDALAATPGLVPQTAIMAARIGEKSNSLGIALRDAAVQTTRNLNKFSEKSNATNLIVYMTVVVSVLFLIASFIMYWIIPKFKKIFLDFGTELPSMTLMLMHASDFIMTHFYVFLPLFSLPLIALVLMHLGTYYGWYNLRIPFITGWFPRLNTPQCLRQIAQSISVQQPPQIALDSVSRFHLWADVRERTQSVSLSINQGENIWDSLRKGKVITGAEAALCVAAERMGNLPYVLRTLADTIEQRRARKLRFLSEILKPILISFLGILVGFFVVALFMPLIKLLNDLS
jgi:type II secretory pathway component PulF